MRGRLRPKSGGDPPIRPRRGGGGGILSRGGGFSCYILMLGILLFSDNYAAGPFYIQLHLFPSAFSSAVISLNTLSTLDIHLIYTCKTPDIHL